MNFDELYNSAYDQNLHHQPRKFVEFFEHHRILIEGQNLSSGGGIIYDQVTRLASDYAHSLIHNESYSKAGPEIERVIRLFENHPGYEKNELFESQYYEIMVFDRAVVNYYAKNYKTAITDLSLLSDRFPDNEKYGNWLKSAKAYKLFEIESMLWWVIPAAILADLFAEDSNLIISTIITSALIISIVGIGVIEILKRRRGKKPA